MKNLLKYGNISRPPSRESLSHFLNLFLRGLHQTLFTNTGYRRIVRFSCADRDGPSPQTAFIQSPHIDPGRDKYGSQPESLRRTFLFTWMATLVINCYMMEAIEELGKTYELSYREGLCRVVINRFLKWVTGSFHPLRSRTAASSYAFLITSGLDKSEPGGARTFPSRPLGSTRASAEHQNDFPFSRVIAQSYHLSFSERGI
jgi:hypothetical protein